MPRKPVLTDKMRAFAMEYIVDLNITQAAIRAGYSERSAAQTGFKMFQNPLVQELIQELKDARAERTEITSDRVLEELGRIGFSNILDYFSINGDGEPYIDLSDIDREQAAALGELQVEDFLDGRSEDARDVRRVKIKILDKLSALEKIGRHLGMFPTKVDITNPDGSMKPVTLDPTKLSTEALKEILGARDAGTR